MSISRAFTTRRAKQSIDLKDVSIPKRSNTTAKGHGHSGSIRNMISAPMELTHTTNMLAFNAPDLYPRSASTSSKSSDDESDGNLTGASSPPTSPDTASLEDRSVSPEPNHLSCYFTAPGQTLSFNAPKIPQRAPTHTKKASMENLAQRQTSRLSSQSNKSLASKASFTLSRSSSTSTTATSVSSGSMSYMKSPVPEIPPIPLEPVVPAARPIRQRSYSRPEAPMVHPFGNELAQVSEIAEDYGVHDKLHMVDKEEQELIDRGLCRFKPEDYLAEVQGLISSFFSPEPTSNASVWI